MTRIEYLKSKLPEGYGAAIFTNSNNRFYLTGMRSSAGMLVITPDKAYFFTDSRYIELAKRTIKGCEVAEAAKITEDLAKLLSDIGVKKCMMENIITVAEADRFKAELKGIEIDLSSGLMDAVLACREIKDAEEHETMKKAQQISDDAFEKTISEIKVGMTEREVRLKLDGYMREFGAEDTAFDSIVVSGENGSLPHGVPGERKLQKGDMVTIDFGAKYKGYCTDITRTIAIGEISKEQHEIYDIVKTAQETAVAALKAGMGCVEMDKISRDIITEKGFGEMFRHGLGHSLGIEIHEEPRFSPSAKGDAKVGMVMTIEPGIYVPGKYGVRIEDSCIITETGCIPLSRITKELITIEV